MLLVEDEPQLAKSFRSVLAAAGFEVIGAATGKQALEAIEAGAVDVVVMEQSIPGIDGVDLVRKICERLATIPVILMLDALDNGIVRRAFEAGARSYLVKPDPELLKQTVLQSVRLVQSMAKAFVGTMSEDAGIELVPATRAKNAFGVLLDKVIEGRRLIITKHETPKAVVLPYADYKALEERGVHQLNTLSAEFDQLLARMQTAEARAGMRAAFDASPAELGKAAVAAARKRG